MSIGFAIAAPVLLPLVELRSVGTSYKFHATGDFIRRLQLSRARQALPIGLFAPALVESFFARIHTLHPFGVSIGFLASAAALAGLLRRGLGPALAAILGLGIVLVLQPPPFGFVERLPVLSLLLPPYAWSLVVLVLSHAAGRGIEAFGDERERRRFLFALLLLPAAALSLLLIRDDPDFTSFASLLREAMATEDGKIRLLFPHGFALAAVAACLALPRAEIAARVLIALLVVERLVTVVPLVRNSGSQVLAAPPSPAVRFLRERLAGGGARMIGLPREVGFPLTPMLYGLPDLRVVSALPVRRLHDYLETIGPEDTSTILTARVAASPLLELASVRYLVLPRVDLPEVRDRFTVQIQAIPNPKDPSVHSVYRDSTVEVWENQAALPRLRIVHRSVAVADPAAALDWVNSAAEGSEHANEGALASTVVLEPDADGASPPEMSFQAAPEESVRLVEQADPDRLVVEVELVEPGLLVIADTYYPGWKAWLDGTPAGIHPANFLFRAVAVPPGRHRVELRYEPRSFRLGAALFAGAALACAAAFVRSRRASGVPV